MSFQDEPVLPTVTLQLWSADTFEREGMPIVLDGIFDWVRFSPDGSTALIRMQNGAIGTATLTKSPSVMRRLSIRPESLIRVAEFSSDGRWLLIGTPDEALICEVTANTTNQAISIESASPIASASFSKDGREIAATLKDGQVVILNSVSGKEVGRIASAGCKFTEAILTRDNRYVLTLDPTNKLIFWNRANDRREWEIPAAADPIASVEIDKDETKILILYRSGIVRLVTLETGVQVCEPIAGGKIISRAHFTDTGNNVLALDIEGTASQFKIVDRGKFSFLYSSQSNLCSYLGVGSNGLRIVNLSLDHALSFWDERTRNHHFPVVEKYSTKGRLVSPPALPAVGFPSSVSIWPPLHLPMINAIGGDLIRTNISWESTKPVSIAPQLPPALVPPQFSDRLSDPAAPEALRRLYSREEEGWRHVRDRIQAIGVNSTGEYLMALNGARQLFRAELSTQSPLVAAGQLEPSWDSGVPIQLDSVVFDRDLSRVAAIGGVRSSRDGESSGEWFVPFGRNFEAKVLCVWGCSSRKLVSKSINHPASALAISPDGTLLASISGGAAWLWDIGKGLVDAELISHDANFIQFLHNGRQLATCSKSGDLRIWDVSTRTPIADVFGIGQPVVACETTRDGKFVFVADSSGNIRIWDTDSAQPVSEAVATKRKILSIATSHGQEHLYVLCRDAVLTWHLPPIVDNYDPWVMDVAEAMVGQRLDYRGVAEPVPTAQILKSLSEVRKVRSPTALARWANRALSPEVPATR